MQILNQRKITNRSNMKELMSTRIPFVIIMIKAKIDVHVLHYIGGRKEGRNVLFNDALDTFLFTVIWRQTYG